MATPRLPSMAFHSQMALVTYAPSHHREHVTVATARRHIVSYKGYQKVAMLGLCTVHPLPSQGPASLACPSTRSHHSSMFRFLFCWSLFDHLLCCVTFPEERLTSTHPRQDTDHRPKKWVHRDSIWWTSEFTRAAYESMGKHVVWRTWMLPGGCISEQHILAEVTTHESCTISGSLAAQRSFAAVLTVFTCGGTLRFF